MNELFFFCCTVLFGSAIVGAVALLASKTNTRYLHWPFLWTTSIVFIVFTAALATLFYSNPALLPGNNLDLGPLHPALGPVEVVAWSRGSAGNGGANAFDTTGLLNSIYLVGVAIMLLRLGVGRVRAARIAANATHCRASNGVDFWVTSDSVTPFVIRLLRGVHPFKIVIPEALLTQLSDTEINTVLAHELAHVKRHDDETGFTLRVLIAVMWFTPIAHLLFQRWAQSIELACDRDVIHDAPSESRKRYANTLIKTLHLSSTSLQQNQVYQFPVASFSSNRLKNEKLRIEKIVRGHYNSFSGLVHRVIIAGLAVIMSIGTALAFSVNAELECLKDKSAVAANNQFGLEGRITSRFGTVADPFKQGGTRNHKGIDIAAPAGTAIHAPANAVVIAATDTFKNKPAYGRVVVLQNDNKVLTLMAHLQSYSVKVGQRVNVGDLIARVGKTGKATGTHVHIETYKDGERIDPASVWDLIN